MSEDSLKRRIHLSSADIGYADALSDLDPMPQFFFDSQIGAVVSYDYDGAEYADVAEARPEALLRLAHLAQGAFPSRGGRETIKVEIRNEQGKVLAAVQCVLTVTILQ